MAPSKKDTTKKPAKPKTTRPTIRKVTAQRKFALGAYVPPAAAAAAPASAAVGAAAAVASTSGVERRHHPDPAHSNGTFTTYRSHMKPSEVLNVVCFANKLPLKETNDGFLHTQPIVLLERLQGKNPQQSQDTERQETTENLENQNVTINSPSQLSKRRRREGRRELSLQSLKGGRITKRKSHIKRISERRAHLMHLRSSHAILRLARSKSQLPINHKVAKSCKKRNTDVTPTTKRKEANSHSDHGTDSKKRSIRRTRFSQFSQDDDNMPLTYFVKSNTEAQPLVLTSKQPPSSEEMMEVPEILSPEPFAPTTDEASEDRPLYSEKGIQLWIDNFDESAQVELVPPDQRVIEEVPPSTPSPILTRTATTNRCRSRDVNDQPGPSRIKKNEHLDIMDAPEFNPSVVEFADPIAYIKKIWSVAAKHGICKIVPPEGFAPPCKADDELRFSVTNQYITRLYNRWSSAAKEMTSIKECLKAQNVVFGRPPLIDGVEVNLPKLYHFVQHHGGLENVINKKKWGKVADDMKLCRNQVTERKLDQIYVKYLLPYVTLSQNEHEELLTKVEAHWQKQNAKMLARASNPLHRQKRLLGESEESSADEDDLDEPEDVIKRGVNMNLAKFKKLAKNVFRIMFRNGTVTSKQIEDEYWNSVIQGSDHICVHSASVDTGVEGHGFSKNKNEPYSWHPWNLKMISRNHMNVLRSLGPALGVTVPTLHLGMVFSTSCWHKDPHSIAWMEYLHAGDSKIWYSIPASEEKKFRQAAESMIPTTCQNKALWLPSDLAMMPPGLLRELNVQVYRVEQKPGEFILVMPRAYSSSISTGYTVSESVYFATESWLDTIVNVFQEIRDSCEPTTFSIEQLLISIAEDITASLSVLRKVQPALQHIITEEIKYRNILEGRRVRIGVLEPPASSSTRRGKKRSRPSAPPPEPSPSPSVTPPPVYNVREQEECEICRCTLYLSKVENVSEKQSVVCLKHAVKLLQVMKQDEPEEDDSDVEMFFMYETAKLTQLLTTLNRRIEEQVRESLNAM